MVRRQTILPVLRYLRTTSISDSNLGTLKVETKLGNLSSHSLKRQGKSKTWPGLCGWEMEPCFSSLGQKLLRLNTCQCINHGMILGLMLSESVLLRQVFL